MEITSIRKHFTADATISDLLIDNTFSCYILEDVDRGLTSDMSIDDIRKIKVYGKTAIPTGRYELIMSYSNRFKKFLPQLLNVPGFEGIRIHPGNKKED